MLDYVYDHVYVKNNVKLRDHGHITGKYTGSTHRDCNANVKLNHEIPILFHNLTNYESHLIQQLDKFDFKTNVILNRLDKYLSLNMINKLVFIESFQFLSASVDSKQFG